MKDRRNSPLGLTLHEHISDSSRDSLRGASWVLFRTCFLHLTKAFKFLLKLKC